MLHKEITNQTIDPWQESLRYDKSQIYDIYPYILSILYCLSPVLGILMCVLIL